MIRFRKMPYLAANVSPKYVNERSSSEVFIIVFRFTGRMAYEVMEPVTKFISFDSTIEDIKEMVKGGDKDQTAYPIVESKENMILVGAAQKRHIEQLFFYFPDEATWKVRKYG